MQLGAAVESIERREGTLVVRTRSGENAGELEADMVVHGAGRTPEIGELALNIAGVSFDPEHRYVCLHVTVQVQAAHDTSHHAPQLVA